jgi:hypothetical protein
MAQRESAGTVRFSALVQAGGKPKIYLPLSDPKQDRNFMRAVREERVLSLIQKPTGAKKAFGTVGFVSEKHVAYLIFPKPLTAFADRRVVGIKYETVEEADLSTPRLAQRSIKPAKPKPRPRPRKFTATVRVTRTNEIKVSVKALDADEARPKLEQKAKERAGDSQVETKLLTVSED